MLDGALFSGPVDEKELPEFFAEALAKDALAEALSSLNADFSLGIFDKATKAVFLARDRFGIKPLYFGLHHGGVAFASLPLDVANLLQIPVRPRAAYVSRFLACHYRYVDNEPQLSPYENILQVAPSEVVKIANGRVERTAYWKLKDNGDSELPEQELAERYRSLLLDSVKIRVQHANAQAFTLSGGMDSSSVLASAVTITGEKQIAYSSVYDDKTFDESEDIRTMLDSNVSKWRTVKIDMPDTFEIVSEMVKVHQEPVITATWLSHFILSDEAAKAGIKCLFGGLGGDELNAGEYEYFWPFFADLKLAGHGDLLNEEVDAWARYHDHPIYKKNRSIVDATLPRLVDFGEPGKCLPDRDRMLRYQSVLDRSYYDLSTYEPWMPAPFRSYLKNRCLQDLFIETAPPCLRAEDRHGAHFGIENLLPFLDHRLVEFMFQVRGTQKFRKGVTKHLLREAMKGILPEETRTRVKKTGWNAPAHIWFSGKGRGQLLDIVHSREFRERGFYNVVEIERLVNEHEETVRKGLIRENHMMFLWQLVNLELWLRSLRA